LQNIENKIHQQELQQEQTQEYNDQQQQEIKKQIKLLEKMYLDDDKK
jgi:hypothetical protein